MQLRSDWATPETGQVKMDDGLIELIAIDLPEARVNDASSTAQVEQHEQSTATTEAKADYYQAFDVGDESYSDQVSDL